MVISCVHDNKRHIQASDTIIIYIVIQWLCRIAHSVLAVHPIDRRLFMRIYAISHERNFSQQHMDLYII